MYKLDAMRRRIKREFIEWGLLVLVFGSLYVSGWHTEVLGRVQQLVVATGALPSSELVEEKGASFNFTLTDHQGNTLDFERLRGKVIFLNFWATWCPPCIAEMPDINNLYATKKNEAIFILISVDKDRQKAQDFIRRKGFEFPIYFLNSPLPETYDVQSIPTTYLIDKAGNIRVENHRMASYNTESFRNRITALSKSN